VVLNRQIVGDKKVGGVDQDLNLGVDQDLNLDVHLNQG
jgi:hypothetical protein